MGHELSTITVYLNALIGSITGHETHLSDQAVISWFIVVVSALVFIPMSRRFSVDKPGVVQQMLEIGVESINAMLDGFIGPHGRKYFPVMAGFAFFILASNLITNVPATAVDGEQTVSVDATSIGTVDRSYSDVAPGARDVRG